MNKETLLKELHQAEEDIKLHDGSDSSFHYYEGLIDGIKMGLELNGETNE